MFAVLLSHFFRIETLLRRMVSDQAEQLLEQRLQGAELLRQSAILEQLLSAVTLPTDDQLYLVGEVEGVVTSGDQKMRLSESQQGTLTLTATHKGKPAKVDGIPKWTVQAGMESAIDLVVAPDGFSAVVKGKEFATDEPNVKSLSILVSADSDLSVDVKTIEASASIELIRDEADVLALTESEVTDQ